MVGFIWISFIIMGFGFFVGDLVVRLYDLFYFEEKDGESFVFGEIDLLFFVLRFIF